MADKEKRSLREFLRHINDYTYRFNPEKGQFRYRELRGVRDTAFDFYMWLKCWKDMVAFVAKCPVSAVRALFRYQWFATYLTYPNFVDRGTLGMRGNQLRMARAQYDRIVKKATDLLRISFVADEHFHPGNKLSKKVVLFDELVPGEIMAGFPNLIYLPAQVLPVFLCSILDQQITPPYLDAAENFGIPGRRLPPALGRGRLRPARRVSQGRHVLCRLQHAVRRQRRHDVVSGPVLQPPDVLLRRAHPLQ